MVIDVKKPNCFLTYYFLPVNKKIEEKMLKVSKKEKKTKIG